jgi:hypothetical protein
VKRYICRIFQQNSTHSPHASWNVHSVVVSPWCWQAAYSGSGGCGQITTKQAEDMERNDLSLEIEELRSRVEKVEAENIRLREQLRKLKLNVRPEAQVNIN